nr:hypothetical protein [Evansella clarkii]
MQERTEKGFTPFQLVNRIGYCLACRFSEPISIFNVIIAFKVFHFKKVNSFLRKQQGVDLESGVVLLKEDIAEDKRVAR